MRLYFRATEEEMLHWVRKLAPEGVECLQEINWLERYQKPLPPVRVGGWTITSKPSQELWKETLVIPLRSAFGTGHHPTTQMMLEVLWHYPLEGVWVLDVGCGTGILSIASMKRGAHKVIGLDVDDVAVREAVENSQKNFVHPAFFAGTIDALQGVYDLILANLLPCTLVELFSKLRALLAPGGTLLMSGITKEETEPLQYLLSQGSVVVKEVQSWLLLAYPQIPSSI